MPSPTGPLPDLAPPIRLALAYAPPSSASVLETLFALDMRLADILRARTEPLAAQLKLAWWRDRFGEAAERWPRGEPLLARLVEWGENASLLQELPDAWEALLNDELTQPVIREHAHGRGAAWAAAATQCGQEAFASEAARAGACWALADLHENTARPEEREAVVAILQQARGTAFDLPRALRPLTMLGGLARRKAADPARGLAAGGGAYLAMLRIGLTGR